MKKFFEFLLGAVLWLFDFEHIMLFILLPGGLIALGVMAEAGWLYYPAALGIYAVVIWILDRILDRIARMIFKAVCDWWRKRKK